MADYTNRFDFSSAAPCEIKDCYINNSLSHLYLPELHEENSEWMDLPWLIRLALTALWSGLCFGLGFAARGLF